MTSRVIGKGKWLSLEEIQYQDAHGTPKSWECIRRVSTSGAASVVATVEVEGESHVILVRQFRPPLNGWILELPAGLLDPNEKPGITAQRELAEETGFIGESLEVGPFVYNSPGMGDERTALVRIAATTRGETSHDRDEAIEVLTLPLKGLKARLLEEQSKGTRLDAKLWCFALGLDFNPKL